VEHVVAVTHPCHADPFQPAELLANRQQVAQGLAGVFSIGQPVDHGHGGVLRQVPHRPVGVGARHDGVHPPGEIPGHIGDALPRAQLDVLRGQVDGLAAELTHPDLEGDPRPQRRLLEDHRQRLPRGHRRLLPGAQARLELGRPRQHGLQLLPAEVVHREQIAPGEHLRSHLQRPSRHSRRMSSRSGRVRSSSS